MKKIYWRPQGMPVSAFILIALLSVGGLFLVEHFQSAYKRPAFYGEQVNASKLAMEALSVINRERQERGITIDPETDPARSGLIGPAMTQVTSDIGDLESKQTSVNPNFAAVFVDLLKKAHVKAGDQVAVSVTGSFPALNIALYSALATLHLKPTIISSVASSQYGANDPNFLWIDMETVLYKKGAFPFRSSAASLGGRDDSARDMDEAGKALLHRAIRRNGLKALRARSLAENVQARMEIYFGWVPPRIYVNVGGGVASVGIRSERALLKPGHISELPEGKTDTTIHRFLREKIPVIHVGNVKQLARLYDLPIAPNLIPKIGEGDLYKQKRYNRWIAGGVLALILFALYVFGRVDWGFRMLRGTGHPEPGPPKPMV